MGEEREREKKKREEEEETESEGASKQERGRRRREKERICSDTGPVRVLEQIANWLWSPPENHFPILQQSSLFLCVREADRKEEALCIEWEKMILVLLQEHEKKRNKTEVNDLFCCCFYDCFKWMWFSRVLQI